MSTYLINTICSPLPSSVHGFVKGDGGDSFTIVLNSNLSAEDLLGTCIHEVSHIIYGDCDNALHAGVLESAAHNPLSA